MKIIDDNEVGKLWAESNNWEKRPYGAIGANIVQSLICKLVAERTLRFQETSHITRMVDEKDHAVKSFDMDPADWKDNDS